MAEAVVTRSLLDLSFIFDLTSNFCLKLNALSSIDYHAPSRPTWSPLHFAEEAVVQKVY